MRALLPWMFVVAVAAVSGRADARCASPRRVVEPADGAALPPNPELYLFSPNPLSERDEQPLDLRVTSDGRPVTFSLEEVSRSPSFSASRLTVAIDGPAELTVTFDIGFGMTQVQTYRIDPDWEQEEWVRLGFRDERRISKWTCSHEDAVFFTLDSRGPQPSVFLVEWAPTKEAFEREEQQALYFPRSWRAGWGPPEEGEPPHAAEVGLGALDCFGRTIPGPPGMSFARISVVQPDGSVQLPYDYIHEVDLREPSDSCGGEALGPGVAPEEPQEANIAPGLREAGAFAALGVGALLAAFGLWRRAR